MWLGLTTFWLEIPLSWEDIRKNCNKFLHRVVPCQPVPSWWRKWWRVSQQAVHGHQDTLLCAEARMPKENVWSSVLVTLSSEEQLMLLLGRSICPSIEYGFTCHVSLHLKWMEPSEEDGMKSGCDVKLLLSLWLETGSSCFHCLSVWTVRRFCFVSGSNPMRWKKGHCWI